MTTKDHPRIEEPKMGMDTEIYDFLMNHLQAIMENDIEVYRATTHEDLTLYEWWITPNRLDGLPFHDFMMTENARRGTVFGSETMGEESSRATRRFDLSNLKIQRFEGTAIASYTFLLSTGAATGVQVVAHNESRVMVKIAGIWKVVHVHKSPAWQAPHSQPKIG